MAHFVIVNHYTNIETYKDSSPYGQGRWPVLREMTRAEAQAMKENDIGTLVVKAAIAMHRELGPGLLETVYEVILARELRSRGLKVECQVAVPIHYKGCSV
jgi:hypothetical protein